VSPSESPSSRHAPRAALEHGPPPRTRSTGQILAAVFFALLVVLPLVVVAVIGTRRLAPAGRILEIEMRATGGTIAQLYWAVDGPVKPDDVSTVPLHAEGGFEFLRFSLPQGPVETLRFDPIDGRGEAVVRRMRAVDADGRTVRAIDPMVMMMGNDVARITRTDEGVRFVTARDATDPILVFGGHWLSAPPRWYSLWLVTPLSLAWISASAAALLAAAFVFIGRDVIRGRAAIGDLLWLAVVPLTVMWAKLVLLRSHPMPVPFWDQWNGEADALYAPFAEGALTWRQMFALHNEHRIFFSRLLALDVLSLNGQWDPELQMLVNGVLHSMAALIWTAILWLAAGRRDLPLFAAAIVLTFAAPFAVENSLSAFQSGFYFLVLFSGAALWLMGAHRPATAAWAAGWLCALCCVFTIGGGASIVPAIACVVMLRGIADRQREPRYWILNLGALALVAGVGYLALPPPMPLHDPLKAASTTDFVAAFGHNTAFPWIDVPRVALLLWLPVAALAVRTLRRPSLATATVDRTALALAGWVLLQAGALAYFRGAGGAAPASRYLDILSFGFVANVLALLSIHRRARHRWRVATALVFVVWLGATAAGIARLSETMLAGARLRGEWAAHHVANTRRFIATGDTADLLAKHGPDQIPFENPVRLSQWLQLPDIRRVLPAAVREPLDLKPADEGASAAWRVLSQDDTLPMFDSIAGARASQAARFESAPISCRDYRHLRFDVASSDDLADLQLALKPASTGELTPVHLPHRGGPFWSAAFAECPAGPFTVIAADRSPHGWFAFRQPSEIATGSLIAEGVIVRAGTAGVAALALTIAAAAATIRARAHTPPSS
jgi:hypothetical protein